ncbi:MAG: SurA N-terminal domain-containing protein [Lamprobacter sp.]|uniref:hypothetical protein n=1 Tax=Lamprobacter sp. TaxID=3100796 RepID=UPI002B258653|nr:hypothetical protein [Lamprobacter sp.]MEA3643345.1 SurA N-terminal domain-containing protein [Lamprobacter sp.]
MLKLSDSLLLTAAAAGITLALMGLADGGRTPLDAATAARVNEAPIATDEWRSLLERRAQAGVPAEALTDTLDQLIDEELLIQRAAELGILRRDSNVRVAIVEAMQKAIFNEARGHSASEAELRAFYNDNRALFAEPLRLQLDGLQLEGLQLEGLQLEGLQDSGGVGAAGARAGAKVEARAVAAMAALRAGVAIEALVASDAALSPLQLPPVALSVDALSARFPELATDTLTAAVQGEVISHASARGLYLLRVVSRHEASVPAFEAVRDAVLNEWQLQRLDAAYKEHLGWLRERADIRINQQLAY